MLLVRQIKIDVLSNGQDSLIKALCRQLKCEKNDVISYQIKKRSIDARDKNKVYFVYEIAVTTINDEKVLKKNLNKNIEKYQDIEYMYPQSGCEKMRFRPVVVGSGPAGLFCALSLAENGYKPVIIERGEDIDNRISSVDDFWEKGCLKTNSNVQFGEGGAGTFSDGKLNTQIKDAFHRKDKVLNDFVVFGAPGEILYDSKPHIGTDKLVKVVKKMREKILSLGGTFYFNSLVTDLIISEHGIAGVEINKDKIINCDICVLAIGHSSRDTFKMLLAKKIDIKNKPFAIGLRVMHDQKMINVAQYGKKYANYLPNASYKLTYKASNNRGVYSFCMCPGGYVVNASSEENQLAINGMSYYKRDSGIANSAIIVTIDEKDYGTKPLAGVTYQEKLEKLTYVIGKGKIPVQLLQDFQKGIISLKSGGVAPKIKGQYVFANLNDILPKPIITSLNEGFEFFGKKIKGFNHPDTVLAGLESRTSSPVTIIRNEDFEANVKGLYPCGEGAGYAGGIISSAVDGLKVGESIIKKYAPIDKRNVN